HDSALVRLGGQAGYHGVLDDSRPRAREIASGRGFAQPFKKEVVELAIRVYGPLQALELRLLAAHLLVLLAGAIERRHDRGLLGLRRLVAFPDAFGDAAGLVVEILGGLVELALGSDHFRM